MVDPLATAYVRVRPDTAGFRPELQAFLAAQDITANIKVKFDVTPEQLEYVKRTASQPVSFKVTVDDVGANLELDALRAKVNELGSRAVNVKVDDAAAQVKLAALRAQISALADKERSGDISVTDLRQQQAAVLQLEQSLDNLGKTSGPKQATKDLGDLRSAALALAPALGPLAVVGAGGVAGLGAAFGTAAAGIGAFALVAKTDLGSVTTAVQDYEKATVSLSAGGGTKALLQQKEALDSLDPSQRKAAESLISLEGAEQRFSKSFDPQVFRLTADGAATLTAELPKISPLVGNTGSALQGLEDHARSALAGPFYDDFLHYAAVSGPRAVTTLGTAAGDAFTGVLGLVQGLDPLTTKVEGFLDRGAAKLEAFGKAAAAGDSPAFSRFLTDVETDAPKVEKAVDAAANAVVTIGKSFGATAQLELPLITAFSELVTDVGKVDPLLLEVAAGAYTLNRALGPLGGGIAVLKDIGNLPALLKGAGAATAEVGTGAVVAEGGIGKAALALGGLEGTAAIAVPVIGAVALGVTGLAALWEHEKKSNAEAAAQLQATAQQIGPLVDFRQYQTLTQYTDAQRTSVTALTAKIKQQKASIAALQAQEAADPGARGFGETGLKVRDLTAALAANQKQLDLLNGEGDQTQQILGLVAGHFGTTTADAQNLANRYQQLTGRQLDVSGSAQDVAKRLEAAGLIAQTTGGQVSGAASAFETAAQKAQDYSTALDAILKIPADKLSSKIAYTQALTTSAADLKANGGNLDTNTAKGQTDAGDLVALQKATAAYAETAGNPAQQAKAYSELAAQIGAVYKEAGLSTPELGKLQTQLGLTADTALQAAQDSGTLSTAQSQVVAALKKDGVSAQQIIIDLQKNITPALAAYVANAEKYGAEAGTAFAAGLGEGIQGGAQLVQRTSIKLGSGAVVALRSRDGIHAESPSKKTALAGQDFSAGFAGGIGASTDEVVAAATTQANKAVAATTKVTAAAKAQAKLAASYDPALVEQQTVTLSASLTNQLTKAISGGSVGVNAAITAINKSIESKLKADPGDRAVALADASKGGSRLAELAQNLKLLTDQIKGTTTRQKAAQDTLNATVSARDSFASGITSGLAGETTLSAAANGATAPTIATILAGARSQLASLQGFQGNLAALKTSGVNQTLISQIAQDGLAQGSPLAAALAKASPSDIAALNSVEGGISSTESGIGTQEGQQQYGQQVTDQTATLHRIEALLKSQQTEQKTLTSVAKGLASNTGKTLGAVIIQGQNSAAKKAALRGKTDTKPKTNKVK